METMKTDKDWDRYRQWRLPVAELDMVFDFSRMQFEASDLQGLKSLMINALREMEALDSGSVANPDEERMVGHYWLRDPEIAPSSVLRSAIVQTIQDVKHFAKEVREGSLTGQNGSFRKVLLIGIGGSALGPQFIDRALGSESSEGLTLHSLDNTDPEGMDAVFAALDGQLGETLTLVVSKSGKTRETRNGMLAAASVYERAGLSFAQHAVAVTGEGSQLDRLAQEDDWLRRFPMWDWVGGRTSVCSAVGLLPAALQGIDIDRLLEGARLMDRINRMPEIQDNPAVMMASLWYLAGQGQGNKQMVIVPYKDRLEWLSRYLQQLIMESLGKARNRKGQSVEQGLSVFGNKGSTDQHAYIQQLRDGRNDFFVTFIEVLKDRTEPAAVLENGLSAGDYLFGFLVGTQMALTENGRQSMTIAVPEVDARSVGALIAVFERAVGLYASLIDINAYHQPGVEAGKQSAEKVLQAQRQLMELLRDNPDRTFKAEELANELNAAVSPEIIYRLCDRLTRNRPEEYSRIPADDPFDCRFGVR